MSQTQTWRYPEVYEERIQRFFWLPCKHECLVSNECVRSSRLAAWDSLTWQGRTECCVCPHRPQLYNCRGMMAGHVSLRLLLSTSPILDLYLLHVGIWPFRMPSISTISSQSTNTTACDESIMPGARTKAITQLHSLPHYCVPCQKLPEERFLDLDTDVGPVFRLLLARKDRSKHK